MKVLFNGKVVEMDDRFAKKFVELGMAELVKGEKFPEPKPDPFEILTQKVETLTTLVADKLDLSKTEREAIGLKGDAEYYKTST